MAPTPGQVYYEAYRLACGGFSRFSGDGLPKWEDVLPDIQLYHEISASCTIIHFLQETSTRPTPPSKEGKDPDYSSSVEEDDDDGPPDDGTSHIVA